MKTQNLVRKRVSILSATLLLLVMGSTAQASSLEETVIKGVETSHQLKCSYAKFSLGLVSTAKNEYNCNDQDGDKRATIKFKYEAHNRGQMLEQGKILSFSVSFNP